MDLHKMTGAELRAAADFLWEKGYKEQSSILHDVARLAEAEERESARLSVARVWNEALSDGYDPVAEAQAILRESR